MTANPEVNSLVRPVNSRQVPFMHNETDGKVRVTRREFVGDLRTSDIPNSIRQYRFALTPGPNQGGDGLMAPWLSGIALHWQKYCFLGLAFEYIPTSSIISTGPTPALGSISMGVQYDSDVSTAVYTKLDVLNLDNAASGSPASSMITPIECAGDQTVLPIKYIYDPNAVQASGSSRWNDLGRLVINIEGMNIPTGGFTVGELWVTYDVVFMGTKLPFATPPRSVVSFLEPPFKAAYQELEYREPGVFFVGRTPEEWMDLACKRRALIARLSTPEAIIAWTRAEFAAARYNEGFSHRPGRRLETQPQPSHLPPAAAEGEAEAFVMPTIRSLSRQ